MPRSPADTYVETGVVEYWKELTQAGNRCFRQNDLNRATAHYQHAQDHIEAYFGDWPDPEDATAALVVSSLNLSIAHAESQHLADAAHVLCTVHARLMATTQNPSLCPGLRQAAFRHLRETFAALCRFQADFGRFPEISRTLGTASSLITLH